MLKIQFSQLSHKLKRSETINDDDDDTVSFHAIEKNQQNVQRKSTQSPKLRLRDFIKRINWNWNMYRSSVRLEHFLKLQSIHHAHPSMIHRVHTCATWGFTVKIFEKTQNKTRKSAMERPKNVKTMVRDERKRPTGSSPMNGTMWCTKQLTEREKIRKKTKN